MGSLDTGMEKGLAGAGAFVGEFVHALDSKKRITIPSEWRVQVGDPKSLYVLPGVHHKCLCVYPAEEIIHKLQKVRQHSVGDKKARHFARILGSQSDLVTWDTQGRIRIKDRLLEYAGLTDQVAMLGALNNFELWNPDYLQETGEMEEGLGIQEAAQYVGF